MFSHIVYEDVWKRRTRLICFVSNLQFSFLMLSQHVAWREDGLSLPPNCDLIWGRPSHEGSLKYSLSYVFLFHNLIDEVGFEVSRLKSLKGWRCRWKIDKERSISKEEWSQRIDFANVFPPFTSHSVHHDIHEEVKKEFEQLDIKTTVSFTFPNQIGSQVNQRGRLFVCCWWWSRSRWFLVIRSSEKRWTSHQHVQQGSRCQFLNRGCSSCSGSVEVSMG